MNPRPSVFAAGKVLTPAKELTPGYVVVEGDRVAEVRQGTPRRADREFPAGVLVPGLVDLQVNGAAGVDFLQCTQEQFAAACRYLASTGTASFLPTLVSAPLDTLRTAAGALRRAVSAGARALGLHLEGPALNPNRAGAHDPRWLVPADDPRLRTLVEELEDMVRLVTLAPELPGGPELVRWLVSRGVVVSLGHTDATYAQTQEAFQAGATMVTHLFNAMRGLHHREPGPVGAALEEGEWACSLVADGIHVHPSVFRLAYRLLGPDRVVLVTDAVAAAGAPPGRYRLGEVELVVRPGDAPRLPDGTLAGSILRMDQAVWNVTRWGVPLLDAVRMATSTPARVLKLADRGHLRSGARADLCVLASGRAVLTVVGGEVVWQSA